MTIINVLIKLLNIDLNLNAGGANQIPLEYITEVESA